MRQIVLNRQIIIFTIHVLKQGLVGVFTLALYNIHNLGFIFFKQCGTRLDQHHASIDSPHIVAFFQHLSFHIFYAVIVFDVAVAYQIGYRRRRFQTKYRVYILHNHHIRLNDTHFVVFLQRICENEITRSQGVEVGVTTFKRHFVGDAAVIVRHNLGHERAHGIHKPRGGVIHRIQIHDVVPRILAQHLEEIELQF